MDLAAESISLDGAEHHLDERVRTMWAVSRALVWVVLAFLAGLLFAMADEVTGLVAALAVMVVAVGLSVTWAGLRWTRWTWRAHDDALQVRHGVVAQHTSLVPYHRIQQIDVRRGPLERLLGLSTLILRTASATSDATVPGIAEEHAEALRLALLTRAGVDDAV